jgi:uncharacterized protein YndB with AHSA1/START domain
METSNASIKIEREFSAPVETVFSAWTEPEELKQWWKPLGSQLNEVRNELKEGGEIEYIFEANGKTSLTIKGNYMEVSPKERLVYTWNWQPQEKELAESDYKLSVLFEDSGEGCRLVITQENFKSKESINLTKKGGMMH